MNSEAQEVVNAQVERRLTVLENDMKEVKETVTDIRIDQKDLIKTLHFNVLPLESSQQRYY